MRVNRKLWKLSSNDSGACVVIAKCRQAPSFVKLHTVQLISHDWLVHAFAPAVAERPNSIARALIGTLKAPSMVVSLLR